MDKLFNWLWSCIKTLLAFCVALAITLILLVSLAAFCGGPSVDVIAPCPHAPKCIEKYVAVDKKLNTAAGEIKKLKAAVEENEEKIRDVSAHATSNESRHDWFQKKYLGIDSFYDENRERE